MNWKIIYTPNAKNDINDIYDYITCNLNMPIAADRKTGKIIKKIRALKNMPMMYKVYDKEPWKTKQLRSFSVDSYIVFYYVKEETKNIYIARIIYGRRDLNEQLENSDDL